MTDSTLRVPPPLPGGVSAAFTQAVWIKDTSLHASKEQGMLNKV